MKDHEIERIRKWGYAPRICYAKAMNLRCVCPKLTCDKCEWGNKTPQRFARLKLKLNVK